MCAFVIHVVYSVFMVYQYVFTSTISEKSVLGKQLFFLLWGSCAGPTFGTPFGTDWIFDVCILVGNEIHILCMVITPILSCLWLREQSISLFDGTYLPSVNTFARLEEVWLFLRIINKAALAFVNSIIRTPMITKMALVTIVRKVHTEKSVGVHESFLWVARWPGTQNNQEFERPM